MLEPFEQSWTRSSLERLTDTNWLQVAIVSFQAAKIVILPKTNMPINVSPRLKAPRVLVNQFPVRMRYPSRGIHEASWFVLGVTAEAGCMGSLWRCDCLAAVWLEGGEAEGKAGSSRHSTLSLAGTLLGIEEGDTDREVVLLGWELGHDESKESDAELG